MQPESSIDLEAHLRFCVKAFEESEDMTATARAASETCRDYFDGKQYTQGELASLRKRGQAPVYDNHVRRKIESICGIERKTRTDPKAFPRTPDETHLAEAATDSIRYVVDANRFPQVRSEVFADILVEGTGAAEIICERRGDDVCVIVKRIPWDRYFYDPHARELDFSDKGYDGIVIWDNVETLKRKYPDRVDAIESSLTMGAVGQTYDDRPRTSWCDSLKRRLRVLQIQYEYEGEWYIATFTRGGFLEDPVVSPYLDKEGKSTGTIMSRSGYVDRDNNRYGHCKDLIPLQDEINKRRSKALHIMSQRQTFGNKRAIADVKKAKTELAKPDGHLEINEAAVLNQDFGVLPTGDMAQGQVLMFNMALQSMNATGANAAVQGKDERAQSGVALQTRIQSGAIELEPQTDGLKEFTHACYEAIWLRIRQFWTAQKWIRVTDDDRNVKFVGLNQPVTLGEFIGRMDPEKQAAVAQRLQLQPGDPRLQQVVDVENNVNGLDVDIVLDEGPDIATLQSEQFEELVKLAGTPQGQQVIPFTAIIKASSLRNKDQIIDEIEKREQQTQQAQQQAQQTAQQLGQATATSDIRNKDADTAKKQAETQATQVETHITGMQALAPQPVPMIQ